MGGITLFCLWSSWKCVCHIQLLPCNMMNRLVELCEVEYETTLGRRLLKCFVPISGTSGLWSVLITKHFPSMYMANFSQAQVMASASFSIWAYLLSVSDGDLDAYSLRVASHCRSFALEQLLSRMMMHDLCLWGLMKACSWLGPHAVPISIYG